MAEYNFDILEEIENKYPEVSTVTVDNEQIWPWLRFIVFMEYNKKVYPQSQIKKLQHIKHAFYGLKNWFRKYDYIMCSSAERRIYVMDRLFDRFFDPLIDKLGQNRCLIVEELSLEQNPINQCYTKHIGSINLARLFARILNNVLIFKHIKIQNKEILLKIFNEYNINLYKDIETRVKLFYFTKFLYKFLLKHYKSKYIIIIASYNFFAIVKAAKELNIKVIETQHGIMGNKHIFYNSTIKMNPSFFPDTFLVFGERDKKFLEESSIFKDKKLKILGSFYINFVNENFVPNPKLTALAKGYKRVICFTFQRIFEKEFMAFVIETSKKLPDDLFLIKPRINLTIDLAEFVLPKNIVVWNEIDFYNTVKHCDIHCTITSTCAIESPALGVRNIIYDYNGEGRNFLGVYLKNDKISRFVKNTKEFIEAYNYFAENSMDKEEIKAANIANFAVNYNENLKKIVDDLKKI